MDVRIGSIKEEKVTYSGNSKIVLTEAILAELNLYAQEFSGECSGCGLVERVKKDGEFSYKVTRLFLPKQDNTGSSTDIEMEEVGRLVTDLVREGVDTSKLRFHWHSHADMDVFHSATDEDNYNKLHTGEFLVSLVINKKGDMYGRIDYYEPFRMSFIGVPVVVDMELPEVESSVKDNLKHVKKSETKPYVYSSNYSKSTTNYEVDWQAEPSQVLEMESMLDLGETQGLCTKLVRPDGSCFGAMIDGVNYSIVLEELTPYELRTMMEDSQVTTKEIKPSNIGDGYGGQYYD